MIFYTIFPVVLIIFLSMLLFGFFYIGFYLRRFFDKNFDRENVGDVDTITSAMLGLFALFLGFTFSMAFEKYNERVSSIAEEANALSNAIDKTQLYNKEQKNVLQKDIKNLISARIQYFQAGDSEKHSEKLYQKARHLLNILYQSSLQSEESFSVEQMISSIEEVSDAMNTRHIQNESKIPSSIIWTLIVMSVVSSFLLGYGTDGKKVNFIIIAIYTIMVVMSIYLIIDLDKSREGMINTEAANRKIIQLYEKI